MIVDFTNDLQAVEKWVMDLATEWEVVWAMDLDLPEVSELKDCVMIRLLCLNTQC